MQSIDAEMLHSLLRLDLYDAGWLGPDEFPDQSNLQIAMTWLDKSLLKKFHNDEIDLERNKAALALFLKCNDSCKSFSGIKPRDLKQELIINEFKSNVYDFFNPMFRNEDCSEFREPFLLNLSAISKHYGLGNGTNIGAKSTDFYTKFVNSTMAHTDPILLRFFKQTVNTEHLWRDVEAYRDKAYGVETVKGSRLSFVPKSRVISRTICTEPVLNMLFHKGIAGVIEERLRQVYSIDLSTQPDINSAMARFGSQTGMFGTIDLSSASDTIALTLIKEVIPRESLFWLLLCRSPFTILPDGSELELHMISSMGNGYTFPLQTMLFACLVAAVYKVLDIPIKRPRNGFFGNYAVFGDDIIVDQRAYNAVVDCLEVLGFTVNRDKSFNEGFFRESCGSDFYKGYNIRGVYIKTMRSPGDIYSAINRLNYWSAKHGIFLRRTVGYLRRGCRFIGVPFDEADDSGIKIPSSLLRTRRTDINGAYKYVASVNIPRRVRIPAVDADGEVDQKSLVRIRKVLPGFGYSPDGLLFCLLAGWIGNGSLGLRSSTPKAVLRRRVCPGWDTSYVARGVSREFYEAWKSFVEGNLVNSPFIP